MVKSALPLQLKQIRILTADRTLVDTQAWGNTSEQCFFSLPLCDLKKNTFNSFGLNHSNPTYFRNSLDLCNWKWELNLSISAKVLVLLSQESLEVLWLISVGASPAHMFSIIRFSLAFSNNVCSWFQWGHRLNDKFSNSTSITNCNS